MTMIGQVAGLWPRKQPTDPLPPFEDTSITWTDKSNVETTTRLTGIVDGNPDPSRTGCVTRNPFTGSCLQVGTIVSYRALVSATLTFSDPTKTSYGTAATANQSPVFVLEKERLAPLGWSTSEGVMPSWP